MNLNLKTVFETTVENRLPDFVRSSGTELTGMQASDELSNECKDRRKGGL